MNPSTMGTSSSVTSLGEVQRIIGLSLSKIQMGRNQRGGLPLHKNLLVATVLNKARDLYMQETMYMNYKMMTGQFHQDQMHHQGYHQGYHQNQHGAVDVGNEQTSNSAGVETNEAADYDEDSESDVEDECDPVQPDQQPASQTTQTVKDEGFIDEPEDCDCDARNFSTSESRVPFQYCYNCAPFHPSNGRGPTLVPSPASPSSSSSQSAESCSKVIYDMDSAAGANRKRRRSHDSEDEADLPDDKKLKEENHTSSKEADESGYSSPDSSQHEVRENERNSNQYSKIIFSHLQMFHPAFRGSEEASDPNNGNTMEIDQITSLVSIFSFGQHIMAAAAAAKSRTANPSNNSSATPTEEEEKIEEKKSEASSEDSDSESDTSSDSGHSSDNDNAKEELSCTSTAAATSANATTTPPCVEVASL